MARFLDILSSNMKATVLSVASVVILIQLRDGQCSLHNRFRHFQVLKTDSFTTRVKRDTATQQVLLRTLSFSALQKDFILSLTPGSPIVHPEFEAHLADANGQRKPLSLDKERIYTGYLGNNANHSVHAVYIDGMWLAHIYAPDDVYSIEPLRHYDKNASPLSVLIFKFQDIRTDNVSSRTQTGTNHCEIVSFNSDIPDPRRQSSQTGNSNGIQNKGVYNRGGRENPGDRRGKRTRLRRNLRSQMLKRKQAGSPTSSESSLVCDIFAVADYDAFQGIGDGNPNNLVYILLHIYQVVNKMLTDQRFLRGQTVGVIVKKILVHTDYTESPLPHYNMKETKMTASEALATLTSIEEFKLNNYCIGHLTSQRNFGGALGASSIAEASSVWHNGICANSSRNVGLSTLTLSDDYVLDLLSYTYVVTHEIGHNWGSPHDPEFYDPTCSPRNEDGGKYIMWIYAGLTTERNSNKFSPCSRRAIRNVLEIKAAHCFIPRASISNQCGDGLLGPGEDCDSGSGDECCDSNCKLRNNATCSPISHPCCTRNCLVAPSTQTCYGEDENLLKPCFGLSYCSGADAMACPPQQPLPDIAECGQGGRCWHGECKSHCQLMGMHLKPPRHLKPCHCDRNRADMCFHCCREGEFGSCQVTTASRKDGSPCLFGRCSKNRCVKLRSETPVKLSEVQILIIDRTTRMWYVICVVLTVCCMISITSCYIWSSNRWPPQPNATPRRVTTSRQSIC